MSLLSATPRVVNVGLEQFASDLARNGVPVVHVDWRPPAGGDARLIAALDALDEPDRAARIEAANAEALRRLLAAEPVLLDVVPAHEAIPELGDRTILHSGPP